MSADVRIDLTVTVDGLPPLLRLGLPTRTRRPRATSPRTPSRCPHEP